MGFNMLKEIGSSAMTEQPRQLKNLIYQLI